MIIYEVPIYSMSKEEFDRRCELGQNEKISWKYNQIIGYLVISYKYDSIWFDKYFINDKNSIENYRISDYHFYIKSSMDDDEIKKNIEEWIKSFEQDHIEDRCYLDKGTFIDMLKYINIKEMINDKK